MCEAFGRNRGVEGCIGVLERPEWKKGIGGTEHR